MKTWNDYKEHIHQIGDREIAQDIKKIEEIASTYRTITPRRLSSEGHSSILLEEYQ